MQNLHLLEYSAKACVPLSMVGGSGGTGCDEVCFPVHGGWDSRDVIVAAVFDCVKECVQFTM